MSTDNIQIGRHYTFHQIDCRGMYVPGLEGNLDGAVVLVKKRCGSAEYIVQFPDGRHQLVFWDELEPLVPCSMFSSCRIPYIPTFHVEECVLCIDASESQHHLRQDHTYRIATVYANGALGLEDYYSERNEWEPVVGTWHPGRFRRI